MTDYDLIIIGAGPAGLTASIYASRYRVSNVVIGQNIGGMALEAHKICNYPSEKDISGFELISKIQDNVKHQGAEIKIENILKINKQGEQFELITQSEKTLTARTLLVATGTIRRKLGLPDEEKFLGKGVHYCATCDGGFYRGKVVAIAGGSNSAMTAALYLAELAEKVYLIYRGQSLRGETAWVEELKNKPNIEIIYQSNVTALAGEGKLEKIILTNTENSERELMVDGLFIEIGSEPDLDFFNSLGLDVNDKGYIKVNLDQSTNVEGIWAAGDVTTGSNNFRQIITACAEGAVAAESIFKYLQIKK